MAAVRTCVTFRAACFNTTVERDYFINPGCFGDDLLRWMIPGLTERGAEIVGDLCPEDYGWILPFRCGDRIYHLVAGYQPEDQRWLLWIEPSRGLLPSLFLPRGTGVPFDVPHLLHAVLLASPDIHEIQWHLAEDFDAGHEDGAASEPSPMP